MTHNVRYWILQINPQLLPPNPAWDISGLRLDDGVITLQEHLKALFSACLCYKKVLSYSQKCSHHEPHGIGQRSRLTHICEYSAYQYTIPINWVTATQINCMSWHYHTGAYIGLPISHIHGYIILRFQADYKHTTSHTNRTFSPPHHYIYNSTYPKSYPKTLLSESKTTQFTYSLSGSYNGPTKIIEEEWNLFYKTVTAVLLLGEQHSHQILQFFPCCQINI